MIETPLERKEPRQDLLHLRKTAGVDEGCEREEGNEAHYHAKQYETMCLESA